MSFLNLFWHKSRTALSLLGIVIGVMAIIALVAVIDGIQLQITEAIGKIEGVNVIQKGAMGAMLSKVDQGYVEKLEKIQGVRAVVPNIMTLASSVDGKSFGGGNAFGPGSVVLIGIDLVQQSKTNKAIGISGEILEGRELRAGDKGKVEVGESVMDDFDKFVGGTIKLNGKRFEVVGSYTTGAGFTDSSIVMEIEDLRELIDFPKGKVSLLNVQPLNPAEAEKIKKTINFRYSEELNAVTSSSLTEMISSFIEALRVMVFVVAAIAAIVAGIGIINTMLMSVLERFKEIGALKAVGWANSDIMKMILFESTMIGLIGGIIGVVLGTLFSGLTEALIGIPSVVTIVLVAEAMAFALGVGLIAGLYPAWVASKMEPAKALAAE